MHLITIPRMIEAVRVTAVGEGEPCMFWGPPGCGKTEGIHGAAKEIDAEVIDIRLGQYDSVDLRGFPGVDPATDTTRWHMPSTLPFEGNPKFDPAKTKIIFLDEINAGKPSVLGVAYQLVQEERVGEHKLQPNTFIVAAGNRDGDKGVTNKMPKPLDNRFTHYEVGADANSWVLWAAGQPRIPGELMAFLQFRTPLISNFDPKSTERAFATPRTWEKAGKYFTSQHMSADLKDASIEGVVGEAAATEFRSFCEVIKDMPKLRDIEANPDSIAVPEKLEVRWAVAIGISGEFTAKNERAFSRFLKRLDPEYSILTWQLALQRQRREGKNDLIGTQGFIDISREHQATFAEVNRGK